jgi:hypothetical protein
VHASQPNIVEQAQVTREGDQLVFTGTIRWTVQVDHQQAPDQLQREVEKMGQQVKREVYAHVLQDIEGQLVSQFQIANPHLQRRGTRPYTLVAPFGKIRIRRTRLFDRQTRKWSVPAKQMWKTSHRHCLLPGLKEAACQQTLQVSVRKTVQALDQQAGEAQLISPATVVNLYHQEGRRLDQTQRRQAERILQAHPQALACGLAGPLHDSGALAPKDAPADAAAPDESGTSQPSGIWTPDSCPAPAPAGKTLWLPPSLKEPEPPRKASDDDLSPCVCQGGCPPSWSVAPPDEPERDLPELTEQEQEEIRQRAIGFMRPDSASVPFSDATDVDGAPEEPGACGSAACESGGCEPSHPAPRRVDPGWVAIQVDEVLTSAQPCQQAAQATQGAKVYKRNHTFTATVETEDQTYYLAACCAGSLRRIVAALLCRLGVLEGLRGVLVIGDGAQWIRDWYEALKLSTREMVLCWYHLAKRVYERLSQGGFSKARRQEIEHAVLGHLWKGELSQAVWYLWGVRAEARNAGCAKWITQLIHYLLARRDYLPNYSQRHQAGLWIASTRVEKWNDCAVADRCKRRGMSWTHEGVLALALQQAERRNGPAIWETLPQHSQAA